MKKSDLVLDKGCFLCLLSVEDKISSSGDILKILKFSDSENFYLAYDDMNGICRTNGNSYHDYSKFCGKPTIIKAIIEKSSLDIAPYYVNSIFFPEEKTDGYELSDFKLQSETKDEVKVMFNRLSDVGTTPICVSVLLLKKEEKLGKKGKYYDLSITDKQQTVFAKDWIMKAKTYDDGTVVNAWLTKDSFGYKLENIEPCPDCSPGDFIRHPPINEQEMFDYLLGRLGEYSSIAKIGVKLYGDNKEKLLYWSAAASMHHNIYGGLLYHTYRMVQLAEKMCEVYDGLDKELLITATALHDIGKLTELNTEMSGVTSYSEKGNMLGHAVIGINMIDAAAKELGIPEDDEKLLLLEHCIASHHGQLDFGAITVPNIFEAQILNMIDLTDSRAYMYESQYDELKPGETMSKNHFGLETKVYRPKFTQGKTFLPDYTG